MIWIISGTQDGREIGAELAARLEWLLKKAGKSFMTVEPVTQQQVKCKIQQQWQRWLAP